MSDVSELRKRIELECEAMQQGLTGYAVMAKHKIIAHKYETLGTYQDQLEQLVGTQEAARIVCEAYIQFVG